MSDENLEAQEHSINVTSRNLEVKDSQIIFNAVWSELEQELDNEGVCVPKEIIWLNGAPGSGKGTHTPFVSEFRDISVDPLIVSDLLDSPAAQRMKNAGQLVGDKEVTALVFRAILDDKYSKGVIVDGYPRSEVQVECLKLFYHKLNQLRLKHLNTLKESRFPKPVFHIIVLFVDEQESVRRQLIRGKNAVDYNEKVALSGMGTKKEIRLTDLDVDAAHNRYRTFKEKTYESLKSLREVFHYHYISAQGTVAEAKRRIVEELKYQSSLELNQEIFDLLSPIPLPEELAKHARQDLILRLENYQKYNISIFKNVVAIIQKNFVPIIEKNAVSGKAFINTEDPVFEDPVAITILIDVFSERGFQVTVDIRKVDVPHRIDPNTFIVETKVKKVFRVWIGFKGTEIRRGFQKNLIE